MKQLRFSTTEPAMMAGIFNDVNEVLAKPEDLGELILTKIKANTVYIHGEAESIAGFDIPYFLDGDLGQLDLPTDKQDILMVLPDGNHKCKAELIEKYGNPQYWITLINEASVLK